MRERTRTRESVVSIVLIVLLMVTTLGMVWHHHDRGTCDQCMLCHLVLDGPTAAGDACEAVLVFAAPVPDCDRLIFHVIAWQIPSRAPPA